jgi:predicted dinucleotide-utilizing enzyme
MVELTVDPTINKNKHTIVAEGGFGQMTIELVGVPAMIKSFLNLYCFYTVATSTNHAKRSQS